MGDQLGFALWKASVSESDLLVIRCLGKLVELQLRGGNSNLRSIVLQKAA